MHKPRKGHALLPLALARMIAWIIATLSQRVAAMRCIDLACASDKGSNAVNRNAGRSSAAPKARLGRAAAGTSAHFCAAGAPGAPECFLAGGFPAPGAPGPICAAGYPASGAPDCFCAAKYPPPDAPKCFSGNTQRRPMRVHRRHSADDPSAWGSHLARTFLHAIQTRRALVNFFFAGGSSLLTTLSWLSCATGALFTSSAMPVPRADNNVGLSKAARRLLAVQNVHRCNI
jgi:hypothetical protein